MAMTFLIQQNNSNCFSNDINLSRLMIFCSAINLPQKHLYLVFSKNTPIWSFTIFVRRLGDDRVNDGKRAPRKTFSTFLTFRSAERLFKFLKRILGS